MAIFEPTEDEKATATFLEWDDNALGKFTKHVALELTEMQKNDPDSLKRVAASACALMLVGCCVESNAAELTLNLEGFSHKDKPEGDWLIKVERKDPRQGN